MSLNIAAPLQHLVEHTLRRAPGKDKEARPHEVGVANSRPAEEGALGLLLQRRRDVLERGRGGNPRLLHCFLLLVLVHIHAYPALAAGVEVFVAGFVEDVPGHIRQEKGEESEQETSREVA